MIEHVGALQGVSGRHWQSHRRPKLVDSTGVFCFPASDRVPRLPAETGSSHGGVRGHGLGPVIARRHVDDALKPAAIDKAKPREMAYALTIGGGLRLEVLPSESKTWSFK
jgi:hypothetical protein